MFDWNIRAEKRSTLSPEMQEWYDSEAPGEVADTLIHELHMKPENKVLLINIVGDTVLGLVPLDTLPDYIHTKIGMPLSLAQLVAEHFVVLLSQAKVSIPTSVTTPTPLVVPRPSQNQQPTQTAAPVPIVPPLQPIAPPTQNTWQHTHAENPQERTYVPATPFPTTPPPQAPNPHTSPTIPQYQKPLTSVPQYRNADLYKKPPQ